MIFMVLINHGLVLQKMMTSISNDDCHETTAVNSKLVNADMEIELANPEKHGDGLRDAFITYDIVVNAVHLNSPKLRSLMPRNLKSRDDIKTFYGLDMNYCVRINHSSSHHCHQDPKLVIFIVTFLRFFGQIHSGLYSTTSIFSRTIP